MKETIAELGTAAVLDADNLTVGQHANIGGMECVCSRIEGTEVTFRPLTTRERWLYFWSNQSTFMKLLYIACGCMVLFGIGTYLVHLF